MPAGQFLIASAEENPFNDESFDATFFGLVLHEMTDYQKSLTAAYRVSKHFTFILE